MNTEAIPHNIVNQIGIPIILGFPYVQAPKIIANASAIAPEKAQKINVFNSCLDLLIDNISIAKITRTIVNIKLYSHNRATLTKDEIPINPVKICLTFSFIKYKWLPFYIKLTF